MARSAPTYQSVSRARIESGLTTRLSSRASRLVLEHVADPAHRVQEPPLALPLDAAAEISDVDVDHVALRIEVEPPDVLGQHGPRQHAAGVAQEVLEQRVLARRQLDAAGPAPHLAGAGVEREVGQPEDRRGRAASAPKEDAHAREEFLEGERLAQVVVGAEIEARDLVAHGVPGREHEHGHAQAFLADRLEHAEPVALGQHDVEHDEIPGRAVDGTLDPGGSVAGDLDGMPFLLEALADEARDLSVVLDHQNPHRIPVLATRRALSMPERVNVLCSRPSCSTQAIFSSIWATPRSSSSSSSAMPACPRPRSQSSCSAAISRGTGTSTCRW